MKNIFKLIILIILFTNCANKNKKPEQQLGNNSDQTIEVNKSEQTEYAFHNIIKLIQEKNTPLIDSTNFDNFKSKKFYNSEQLQILQVKKIYPKIDNEIKFESTNKDAKPPYTYYLTKDDFKVAASYKLNLSDKFITIVLTTYKGEHEMESTLVNYDFNGELIDFKVISYDEIAESAFKIESKIEKYKLTISNITWFSERIEEKKDYIIELDGKIKSAVNNDYNSN